MFVNVVVHYECRHALQLRSRHSCQAGAEEECGVRWRDAAQGDVVAEILCPIVGIDSAVVAVPWRQEVAVARHDTDVWPLKRGRRGHPPRSSGSGCSRSTVRWGRRGHVLCRRWS